MLSGVTFCGNTQIFSVVPVLAIRCFEKWVLLGGVTKEKKHMFFIMAESY